MSEAPNVRGPAVAGLLRLLDESETRQCADLRRKAAEKIAAIRRQAYQQARERVRVAVGEERLRIERDLGQVRAAVETELRRRTLHHDARLVESGNDLLTLALQRRWQDAGARQIWADAVLEVCERVMLGREWTMQCSSSWPAVERTRAIERAHQRAGAELRIEEDPNLAEGFRVRCRGVSVDMSVAGILADRAAVDGALLQAYRGVTQGEQQ